MNTFFKPRKVTVSAFFAKAQFKKSIKPKVILSGDWLKKAGFNTGDILNISVQHNTLIITKNDN